MAQQRYAEAAAAFADPMWIGIAQFRAASFKEAAQTFGGMDTAEAAYDQGNALVMLGKYDEAIARYDRALALRPGWPDAEANRALAALRAERVKQTGGEQGDQREKPDEVVYDKDKKRTGGQETQTTGAPMSDEAVRALWLKRVQTRPGRFPEGAVRLPAAGGVAVKALLALFALLLGAVPRRSPDRAHHGQAGGWRGARPACPRAGRRDVPRRHAAAAAGQPARDAGRADPALRDAGHDHERSHRRPGACRPALRIRALSAPRRRVGDPGAAGDAARSRGRGDRAQSRARRPGSR